MERNEKMKVRNQQMKVQKITLKDVEFVKVDGEYEQRFVNEQDYPAF
ncbi:hypothetical protein AAHB63_13240 [Bacillus thuringiensis]